MADELPSYEDSNIGPIIKLQLNEPQKTYTADDLVAGNINFVFSPNLNETFAKASYCRCYVILQLKCAFFSQTYVLRLYKRPYKCNRTIAFEIEGPFPKTPMTYGRYTIPFATCLNPAADVIPPTMSLVNFTNTNGGTKWELASWIAGVDQNGEVEAMYWTADRKEITVDTTPKTRVIPLSLTDRCIVLGVNRYELVVFPSRIPQMPNVFDLEYCVRPLSRTLLFYKIEAYFLTELWIMLDDKPYILTRRERLHAERPQLRIHAAFSSVLSNCALNLQWPERFTRLNQRLVHYLVVYMYTDAGCRKHVFDVDVMPRSCV